MDSSKTQKQQFPSSASGSVIGKGNEQEIAKLQQEFDQSLLPTVSQTPGYLGTMQIDDPLGEGSHRLVAIWDTKANKAAATSSQRFQQQLGQLRQRRSGNYSSSRSGQSSQA